MDARGISAKVGRDVEVDGVHTAELGDPGQATRISLPMSGITQYQSACECGQEICFGAARETAGCSTY